MKFKMKKSIFVVGAVIVAFILVFQFWLGWGFKSGRDRCSGIVWCPSDTCLCVSNEATGVFSEDQALTFVDLGTGQKWTYANGETGSLDHLSTVRWQWKEMNFGLLIVGWSAGSGRHEELIRWTDSEAVPVYQEGGRFSIKPHFGEEKAPLIEVHHDPDQLETLEKEVEFLKWDGKSFKSIGTSTKARRNQLFELVSRHW